MEIPDCYDPIYQAEQREAEADESRLICEYCENPITGDYYWDIGGDLLCERCAAKMYRNEVTYQREVDEYGCGF